MTMNSRKMANLIVVPFGVVGQMGPGNHALDGHAHWRQLANTVEQSCIVAMSQSATSGGNAVCLERQS